MSANFICKARTHRMYLGYDMIHGWNGVWFIQNCKFFSKLKIFLDDYANLTEHGECFFDKSL